MRRIRLVVLFGGRSAEHQVSCVSALHVLDALDPEGYDVVPIGITRQGSWINAADAVAALPVGTTSLPSPDGLAEVKLDPLSVMAVTAAAPIVVFPLLHGPMGEDGTVQGLLEVAGVPYIGAGVLGSTLCMDKGAAKNVIAARGLPQPRWRCLRENELTERAIDGLVDDLGLPMFVKPANLGSSIGVSRVTSTPQLLNALAVALRYDEYVVVEEALIRPREIEVAVLGNAEPRPSVPGEVAPSHDFYDFEEKYVTGTASLHVPANLEAEEIAEAQHLAVATYRALRVDGMARVDLFYEANGRGFLVNEVNTIPGFTPVSMYRRLWEASGLPFASLLDELVRLALERHQRRSIFQTERPPSC